MVQPPQKCGWIRMTLFYASIPVMLLAVAVAVMPLVWAIVHQARRNEFQNLAPVRVIRESPAERRQAA